MRLRYATRTLPPSTGGSEGRRDQDAAPSDRYSHSRHASRCAMCYWRCGGWSWELRAATASCPLWRRRASGTPVSLSCPPADRHMHCVPPPCAGRPSVQCCRVGAGRTWGVACASTRGAVSRKTTIAHNQPPPYLFAAQWGTDADPVATRACRRRREWGGAAAPAGKALPRAPARRPWREPEEFFVAAGCSGWGIGMVQS